MNDYVHPTTDRECSELFNKMLGYAMEKHGADTYDKGAPYIVHPIGVSNVANRFGIAVTDLEFGYYVHLGCIGHDLLEDTDAKYRALLKHFGFDVAEIIYLVTDELGRTKEEVNHKTWPKTRSDERAIAVKLCDRVFNMETSLANKSHQLRRYVEEYKDFKNHLEFYGKHAEVMKRLWAHLDSLYEECVALLAANPQIPSKS
jgi:(p)ppGpp synthase/HD superfamily hydrolase